MKRIIVLLLLLCIFVTPSYAVEKAGFTFNLIKDSNDIPSKILNRMVEPRYYTPTGIVEFHLPLLFKKNTAGSLSLRLSDFSKSYKHAINITELDRMEVEYAKNVTYYKDGVWVCSEFGTGNNSSICMHGYHQQVEDWRIEWKSVPVSTDITINPSKWYMVDFIGYAKASLEPFALDIVPIVKGIILDEFGWWNSSYSYKYRVDVDSTVGTNQAIILNLTIDTASLIGANKLDSNCRGLRIVAGNETSLLHFDWEGYNSTTYGCNQANTIVWVQKNVLADNSSYFWVYYGNLSSNALGNSTDTYDVNYVAVFHLGEGTGSTTYDSVNRIAGTITGSRWIPQVNDGSIESVGYGLEFDGNDLVDFGDNFDITGGALTMELWTQKPIKASSTYEPFGKHGSRDSYWFMIAGNGVGGGNQLSNCIVSGNDAWSTYESTNLGWNWMSCSFDSDNVLHYINGTYDNNPVSADDPINTADDFFIGYEAQYGTDYVGNITEIRISNNVRSADFLKISYDIIILGNQLFTIGAEEEEATDFIAWYNNASVVPATYNPSVSADFQTEWNSSDSNGYNNSLFYSNHSGSWVGYVTSRSNNISYVNVTLPATTFSWYMWANNSDGSANQTANYTHVIAQNSSMACFQTFVESSPITYETELTARCSCTQPEGITRMYQNTTNVTAQNNSAVVYGAGYYDYVCNVTETSNYTLETDTDSFTINRANPTFYSWIGGVLDVNSSSFPPASNITLNYTIGTLTGECSHSSCFNLYWKNESESWKAITEWNYYNPNNFQFIGWNNTLEAGNYYFKANNSETANYSASDIIYQFIISEGLSIDVLDELTQSALTFNITVSNSTFETTQYNLALFTPNSTNMPYGNITVLYSAVGYPERVAYIDNVSTDTDEDYILYLLPSGEGVYVTFFVYSNVYPAGYPNVEVIASRLIGSNISQVDARISDDEGKGYMYLYPYSIHTIDAEAPDGATESMANYYPSGSFLLRIKIEDVETAENVTWLYTNVGYSLTPTDVYIRNTSDNLTLINYTLIDLNSSLEYYGMNISLADGTVIYSNNTTSSVGGSIVVNFNMTGREGQSITVKTWFKKEEYDFWYWHTRYIVVEEHSYLTDFLADLLPDGAIGLSELAGNLIALFLSLAGAGLGKGRLGGTGSSLMFLLILATFTFVGFFNWLIFLNIAFIGLIFMAGNRWF